jgi:hypothetical protein
MKMVIRRMVEGSRNCFRDMVFEMPVQAARRLDRNDTEKMGVSDKPTKYA